jgi:ubiquinone/menaquinone biosynthesis C-methylase UbiE
MKTTEKEKYVPALSFDFLTPFYDTAIKWTTREAVFKEKLAGQIEIPADGGRLLDLACGTATLTVLLKRKFPRADVHGLDGDPKILKIARRKAEASGVEIKFAEAFSTALPYPDEFFDSVVSSLFFHHLTSENKRKTLLEVGRVLKAGGALHVADWGRPGNFLMRLASTPVQWLDGATTRDSYAGKLPELMAEAGFADVVETANFSTVFGTLRLHRAAKK